MCLRGILTAVMVTLSTVIAVEPELNLVPWPRTVERKAGAMKLGKDSRIVYGNDRLKPAAEILSEDILRCFGIRPAIEAGFSTKLRTGDVFLGFSGKELAEEGYILTVADSTEITASTYEGVAHGATTLLQALSGQGGVLCLPRMTVRDQPATSVRWMWLDCKTQNRSVADIEQLLTLCTLYKINYMTIQMGMYQWNMLFSESWRAAPVTELKLPKYQGKLYTLKEMKHLIQYAHNRGVALLPVVATPVANQQEGLLASFPELYQAARKAAAARNTLLIDTEEYWKAYNKRMAEVIDLFFDSPYVHIGETAEKGGFAQPAQNQPRVDTYLKEHNLRGRNDYFKYYMAQVSQAILAQGRIPVIWAGYDTAPDPKAPVNLPVEVVIQHYNTKWGTPAPFITAGHPIVNASWYPYYIVDTRRYTPREVYEWDIRKMGGNIGDVRKNAYTAPPETILLGTSMCCWERTRGQIAFDAFRPRIPAMAERDWNTGAGRTWEDYQKRCVVTDALLERLLHGLQVKVEGLTPVTILYDKTQPYWFADKATVTLTPASSGRTIRCTLDGKEVTPESTPYTTPITLDQTTTVRARAFDTGGRPLGLEFTATYELHPLRDQATGLLDNPCYTDRTGRPDTFRDAMTLTLQSARKGGTIRYTLDGKRVDGKSPVYTKPITITTPARVSAQWFDVENRPAGAPWQMRYTNRGYQRSLTTGTKATSSGIGEQNKLGPGAAVDGMVDRDAFWAATPCPKWLQVELVKPAKIGSVEIVFYWDRHRYYQYTVEASKDTKTWTTVVDATKNTEVSTEKGYRHELDGIEARFLRVTVLKNSANPAAHIVELRAYEAE